MSTSPRHSLPADLLQVLRLTERIGNISPILADEKLRNLEQHRSGLEWAHLGNSNVTLGALRDAIHRTPHLLPPRTGHLGNWSDIQSCCAGALDYNAAICFGESVGYPLVYDLNQTETDDGVSGDWIYLPGSAISRGAQEKLALFTLDEGTLVERGRDHPLFSPFVWTREDGALVPLTLFQKGRNPALRNVSFAYCSTTLLAQEGLFQEILRAVIAGLLDDNAPSRVVEGFTDRVVYPNGIVTRNIPTITNREFDYGEIRFGADDFIEALLLPFRAAANPLETFGQLSHKGSGIPLLSVHFVNLVYAFLKTHLLEAGRSADQAPLNTHMHWGAIGMAGFPPFKHGYFREKLNSTRVLAKYVLKAMPKLAPIVFVLMPAAVYLLWTASDFPRDSALVNDLMEGVLRRTNDLSSKPNLMQQEIRSTTQTWFEKRSTELSAYFLNRFIRRRSVFNEVELPVSGGQTCQLAFSSMTMQQATMLVGAMMEMAVR